MELIMAFCLNLPAKKKNAKCAKEKMRENKSAPSTLKLTHLFAEKHLHIFLEAETLAQPEDFQLLPMGKSMTFLTFLHLWKVVNWENARADRILAPRFDVCVTKNVRASSPEWLLLMSSPCHIFSLFRLPQRKKQLNLCPFGGRRGPQGRHATVPMGPFKCNGPFHEQQVQKGPATDDRAALEIPLRQKGPSADARTVVCGALLSAKGPATNNRTAFETHSGRKGPT